MVRYQIMIGIHDATLSQKLQMDTDLTLAKATKMVCENEATKKQQRTIRHEESAELNAVRGRKQNWHHKNTYNQRPPQTPPTIPPLCTRCGQSAYTRNQCPAKDQTCHRCNKKGHFKKMCKTTRAAITEVKVEPEDDFLGTIHVDATDTENKENYWMTAIHLNEQIVNFKIDTGADVTVISQSDYDEERDDPPTPSTKRLSGPSQEALHICGQFTGQFKRNATQTV